MVQGKPLAEVLAAWFRRALRGPDGLDRLTLTELSRRAGVSRPTLYAIRDGEGEGTDQDTITRIAAALMVPAPRLERILTVEDGEPASSPLALIAEAQALLALAARRLDPSASGPGVAAAHRRVERVSGPGRKRGRRA